MLFIHRVSSLALGYGEVGLSACYSEIRLLASADTNRRSGAGRLVFRLVSFLAPHLEGLHGLCAEKNLGGLLALFGSEGDLLIDEVIVEAYGSGILAVVGIVYLVKTCPVDGTETHGAGLA